MYKEINKIILPLAGVESEHCALIIDKGLSEIKGINSHIVELNNNRAIITTDDELETIPKAVKAIRGLGYDVNTVKKTFPVLNMTCASCAGSSQSVLENTAGVVNVSVNYANATAQVEYVPTITDPQKLKAAMQSIGYDLMIEEGEEAKDELEEIHRKKFKTLKRRTIGSI
ncbi:MAG: cation transporter, partial [Ferruginibacter sp.]